MAMLLMQGERRWKEREDVMHQPACTRISDDYPYTPVQEKHSRFTAGAGPGADHAQNPVSNQSRHSRRVFAPLRQQTPKATFLQGSPIQHWQDQSHTAWQGKHNGGGQSCVQGIQRVPEMDSISLCSLTDNFACLPISLSCISQKDGIPSFSFLCSRAQAIKNKG